uniref:Uncharacterized protein n=1 Tax=viral metagenome TaxID=1070528 RepID=A0A6C0HLD7_9ZZZZ
MPASAPAPSAISAVPNSLAASAAPAASKPLVAPIELKASTQELSTQNLTPDYKQQQTDAKTQLDEEIKNLKAQQQPSNRKNRAKYDENLKKEVQKLYFKKRIIDFNLSYLTQKEKMRKLLSEAVDNGIDTNDVSEITRKTEALKAAYLTTHGEYEAAVLKETEAENALDEIKTQQQQKQQQQQQSQMNKTQKKAAVEAALVVKTAELAVTTANRYKIGRLKALESACYALEDNTKELTEKIREKKNATLFNEGVENPDPPQFTSLKSLKMLSSPSSEINEEYINSQAVKILILNKKAENLQLTKTQSKAFKAQTPQNIEKEVLKLTQTAAIIDYDLKYLIAQKKAATLNLANPMPEIAQYLQARTAFDVAYNNSANETKIAIQLRKVSDASYRLEQTINKRSSSTGLGSGFWAGLGSITFAGLI